MTRMILLLVLLTGCTQAPGESVLTVTLKPGTFSHVIDARGKLEPARAETVSVPGALRGPQSLSWVADNFTPVSRGQVVARLDGQRQQLDAALAQFEIDKLVLDGRLQLGRDQVQLNEILSGQQVTREERGLADRFYSDDPRVYSRIEIIDNMRNKEYLDAKLGYLGWDEGEQRNRSDAEQQLIELKQQGHKSKVQTARQNLRQMEVLAPADGLFVLVDGFQGRPVISGDMVWSGMAIGNIPDVSEMEARLWVLESEAAGLTVDLPVELRLDAYPDHAIAGTVSRVEALAKPRSSNSPVNYFGFTVALDSTDTKVMFPGREVSARVRVGHQEGVLAIPNQALFQKEGQAWVYLKQGDGFVKRMVTLGARSLNRTVITSGVAAGDVVALARPKEVKA
ncbi:HlyD family efflux transporter periplasmic adaptor subunit [Ferrimonas sediminicola]|uniref:HlyD family efflux transporter periplasmic adaptor subunit n=1 Tax=Ferrimonas sediminicola TaxID=2569538 RepID=A0A4U1B9F8_9GAMM|nr:HlyD family efflux transporter periplasmic adaptor subunit [Ferrimonas sediminicola]TKB47314.1 HlyD family efflux transporter periplasmic adaptor subunit [Ferrimonas sediminicola]